MRNILLISQSLSGGGAERVVANLSLALDKNTNLYIVTYEQDNEEYFFAGTRININLPGGKKGIFQKIITALKRIILIKKIKKEKNINISISFLPQTDYANIFSRIKNEKIIIEVSSNTSAAFTNKLGVLLRKFILKRADFIVAVSEGSRRDLIKNYGIKESVTTTIHNSCDVQTIVYESTEKINYNIQNMLSELSDNYIITMGSFRKPKGHWHLIKAFASIAEQIPEFFLVILGDGEYRLQYEQLIKNLKIDPNRIIMPGFIKNPYPVIKKSKLFVFSSIYEGFGNAIIEAMACGVPILSTDCNYGPREIIAPNTNIEEECIEYTMCEFGGLIPSFLVNEDIDISDNITYQEQEMGKAILEMIRDKKLCVEYSIKGLKRCVDFDNVNFSMKWMRLFDEIDKKREVG